MRFVRRFLTCAVLLGLGSSAVAQNLDDAAQKERERRAKLKSEKPSKTYTEEELKQAKGDTYNQVQGPVPTTPSSRPGSASSSGSSLPSIRPTSAPSGEAGWRARAASARQAVTQAEAKVQALEQKAAGLPPGPFGPSVPCVEGAAAGSINGRVTTSAIQLRDESRKNPHQKVCDQNLVREQEAKQVQADLQQAKATLEQARRAVNDLDDQARRAGVPAGWVR